MRLGWFVWMAALLAVAASSGADQKMSGRATAPCQPVVSQIVSIQGQAYVQRQDQSHWQSVRLNDLFCTGDRLRIAERSRAAIVLDNGAVLRIDQNTTIVFNGIEAESTFLIELLRGAAYFFSRKARSLKLTTPFVNGVVRGTEFFARVDDEKTFITLFEGSLQTDNARGGVLLASGQSAIVPAGQAPQTVIVAQPRDAVQWTLYYPPIVAFAPDEFEGAGADAWQTSVRQSLSHYQKGDLAQAFGRIEGLTDGVDDARFFIYRAGLALSVGQVAAARQDIDRALALSTDDSSALALRAIIAVVQNRSDAAISDAEQAIAADPASVPARLALSYAYQARFALDAALDQVQTATQHSPDNALAWARLAELRLATADLDGALTAAWKAVRLAPAFARTHMVLGYAYLTQIKTDLSQQAFDRAIALDAADPLSRLGRGLAHIRTGDLEQGRADIEIAAALDPGNAVIRSYLGKAYFEEKRGPLDLHQFEMAKRLDPQDPTPYFYDAIRKQSINRPVHALQDLETAIALNDNRAVYRSRFLLDQDLAARSASLSRIYDDLDFQELALREGFTSLQADPANYSAHRLLADAYTSRPRHDIARASELLQAQLLQPITIMPVQPQLAETNLFILEGAGPAKPSLNEFNPLFLRNRVAIQASGVVGSKDTLGDEVVVSAVQDNVSLSVGQFYYETDGFRENNDQRHKIYNAFAQIALTHKTSVQAEVRSRDTERGDPFLRFNPDNYAPTVRRPLEITSGRLGFHHALTPSSDLIGSWIYTEADYRFDYPPFAEAKLADNGYIGEIEYLLRTRHLRLTTGAGYLDADRETTFKIPLMGVDSESKDHIAHLFGYLYAYTAFPANVSWTLGVSAGKSRGGIADQEQLNPKIGLTWNIFKTTTLRAAAFRVLEDMYLAKQRLEPTHVAGFNQVYEEVLDGSEVVDAWNYGIGIDHKIMRSLRGGVEFVKRDLSLPYVDLTADQAAEVDWDEKTTRVYLYATPLSWLTVNAAYQFEDFERDAAYTGDEDFVELRTHRFSMGTRLFLPRGFFAGCKATYVDQKGEFGSGTNVVPGQDHFWVFDADIGYRLPRRYGTISVEGKNLFNETFTFQDTDPARPSIYPDQYLLVKFTLTL